MQGDDIIKSQRMSATLDMVENVEKPDGLTGEDLVNTGDGRVRRTHRKSFLFVSHNNETATCLSAGYFRRT